jgi:hypothetical protein
MGPVGRRGRFLTLPGEIVAGTIARPRFYAVLVNAFGAIAGLPAAIGIYGVPITPSHVPECPAICGERPGERLRRGVPVSPP